MTTVAEFSIPSDSFSLGSCFTEFPAVTVELDRVVPTNHELIPYVWVRGVNSSEEEQIEASASDHPDVQEVDLVDDLDGQYLLRVEWVPDHEGILRAIAETGVTLLSGIGSGDTWSIVVRSESSDAISAFQQHCHDHGIRIELEGLHTLSEHCFYRKFLSVHLNGSTWGETDTITDRWVNVYVDTTDRKGHWSEAAGEEGESLSQFVQQCVEYAIAQGGPDFTELGGESKQI